MDVKEIDYECMKEREASCNRVQFNHVESFGSMIRR
jgi:hypothetical protein